MKQNVSKKIITSNKDFTSYQWYDDFGDEHNEIIYSSKQYIKPEDSEKVIGFNKIEIEIVNTPFDSSKLIFYYLDKHLVY